MCQFTAVRTNNPLPLGASITTAMVHSGTPIVNQLTVVPGYAGASYGLVPVYHVPPVFAVQNQVVDSFTLVAQSPVALGLGTRNNYMITVNSAYRYDTPNTNTPSFTPSFIPPFTPSYMLCPFTCHSI